MSDNETRFREALEQIAEIAQAATGGGSRHRAGGDYPGAQDQPRVCTPKSLPARLLTRAAQTAVKINPLNAPKLGPLSSAAADLVLDPLHLVLMTQRYWGPDPRQLTVSFMERAPANLRTRILSHMNAWTKTTCISFVETQGTGDVRISLGPGGFWSYLGTDIQHIPKSQQTMNLEGFSMDTEDSEYHRVVRHETGHTLGFPHEHMRKEFVARIDPQKAYAYFLRTQGWNKQVVDQQVLTPLDEASIMGTPPDETSIMCYQLPGSIMRDGRPIIGGTDIDASDYAFAGSVYPKPARGGAHRRHDARQEDARQEDARQGDAWQHAGEEDWDESEDPEVVF